MAERALVCVTLAGADALHGLALDATWTLHRAHDPDEAEALLAAHRFLVGLVVVPSASERGCARVEPLLQRHPEVEWVGLFAPDSLTLPACRELVVEYLFDHHTLPADPQRLAFTLGHAYGHAALRAAVDPPDGAIEASSVIGRSEAVAHLRRQIQRIAKVSAPVLITGESGSGKELAAQAIHAASARAAGPFVPVNCGAIAPSLIQSELFGHARGAFTGATREKKGLIEAAGTGTIFLDEIGDLPLELQANLLRFLQEGTIARVGSTQTTRVDVRVIAATHVDLDAAVLAGTFREDLYYRLNVLPLHVPPLRERGGDIEMLARHVFARYAQERSSGLRGFSRRAIAAMEAHPWPGNVRELVNRVRRAMALAEGRLIGPADLGLQGPPPPGRAEALDHARVLAEAKAVRDSLAQTRRNVSEAARRLGVSRMTLYRLMAKHRIEP
jgi:DNA-binding NtrC family response regulator